MEYKVYTGQSSLVSSVRQDPFVVPPLSYEQGLALFDELFNRSTESICVLQPNNSSFFVVKMNRTLAAALSVDAQAAGGRDLKDILQPHIFEAYLEKLQRCTAVQQSLFFEYTDHQSNRRYWTRLYPVQTGNDQWVLSITNDITETRKIEQEMIRVEKFKAQEWLASGLVHDFSNLLTGMLGNIYLAQNELNDPEHQKEKLSGRIAQLEQAVLQARRLTGQIASFCRQGQQSNESAILSRIVQQSADFVLAGQDAVFQLDCRVDNEPEVLIDRCRLSQVVQNLLLNAVQNCTAGCRITAVIEEFEVGPQHNLPLSTGRHLKLSLIDNGKGLSDKVMHHLFEPFFFNA